MSFIIYSKKGHQDYFLCYLASKPFKKVSSFWPFFDFLHCKKFCKKRTILENIYTKYDYGWIGDFCWWAFKDENDSEGPDLRRRGDKCPGSFDKLRLRQRFHLQRWWGRGFQPHVCQALPFWQSRQLSKPQTPQILPPTWAPFWVEVPCWASLLLRRQLWRHRQFLERGGRWFPGRHVGLRCCGHASTPGWRRGDPAEQFATLSEESERRCSNCSARSSIRPDSRRCRATGSADVCVLKNIRKFNIHERLFLWKKSCSLQRITFVEKACDSFLVQYFSTL